LQETPQNPVYHAEGNVYIHTCAVLEEFQKGKSRIPNLSAEDEMIYYWASILHDIGKPSTTVWKQNRWSARGHEDAGFPVARDILLEHTTLNASQRRKVLNLVRWHHVPLRWMIDNLPLQDFMALSTQVDIQMVAYFSYYDLMGRICQDKESILLRWEKFAQEIVPQIHESAGTYDACQYYYLQTHFVQKNAIANALKLGNYHHWTKILQVPPIPAHRPAFRCILTIAALGTPVASYLHQQYPQSFILETHPWGVESELPDNAFEAQRLLTTFGYHIGMYTHRHSTIILQGTHTHAESRIRLVEVLKTLGAEITYLFFDYSLTYLLTLNHAAPIPIDEHLIRKSYESLRYPHPWEAHEIKWVEREDINTISPIIHETRK
jgi:hypothetical protein